MSLYKEFSTLFPYLQSVRKIENYLSFDISFPNTWKLPKKYVDENRIMEQQSNIQDERLFSYVSEITESEIEHYSEITNNHIQKIKTTSNTYNVPLFYYEDLYVDHNMDEIKRMFDYVEIVMDEAKVYDFIISDKRRVRIDLS